MSGKSSTTAAVVASLLAMGALGYAAWGTWTLQNELSRLAETRERNMKEMMISLAHTEGQLGRVKEAVRAFDLQQWLAAVEGPLVDRLEETLVDAQRGVVRQEVEKWAEQIKSEQTRRSQEIASVVQEIKAGIAAQGAAVSRVNEALSALSRDQEALSKSYEEAIRAELRVLKQESKDIKAQLNQPQQPSAELRAELEGVKQENRQLREWLEERNAAEEEFRVYVTERLDLFADAIEQQNTRAQEQIDESTKRWQGLFLTLRENHDAELQSVREAVSRLEDERALALEQRERAQAAGQKQERARVEKARETRGARMSELIEFCSRRPESVLCRDLDVR